MNKLAITVFASCCALASFTNARADVGSEPYAVTVRFADLNTATPQGAAALYVRIKEAARQVCHDFDSDHDLARWSRYRQCLRFAADNAITAANLPALTRYAIARGEVLRPNGSPALALPVSGPQTTVVASLTPRQRMQLTH